MGRKEGNALDQPLAWGIIESWFLHLDKIKNEIPKSDRDWIFMAEFIFSKMNAETRKLVLEQLVEALRKGGVIKLDD